MARKTLASTAIDRLGRPQTFKAWACTARVLFDPTGSSPDTTAGGPAPIEPVMLAALLTGLVAFTLGAGWVFLRRVRMLTLVAPADRWGEFELDWGSELPPGRDSDLVLVPAVTVVARRSS